ncbi:MAG: branched-chain amino acid ABC transporter permease [Fusobacteriaceae bacterium]|jgi:branched-chain amino acid transport system permease protein|nr:branched-chain amino acid ABC transporter permease [Fusobacteriaceae bacterium]
MDKKIKFLCTVCLVAVAVIFLFAVDRGHLGSPYVKRILNLSAIYAIVSVSMNLVNGFTGLFSLGQSGFMAIGAFSVAVFTIPKASIKSIFYVEPMAPWLVEMRLPFVAAILIGGLIAAVLALLIGYPVLRLKSDYLAIATLGFSEIIRIVLTNMPTITNGAFGIKRIPPITSMFTVFGIAALCIGIMMLLINSSYGRAFKAIREDNVAAEAMGINLTLHKELAFSVSAFFSAIAGGLYASFLTTIDPKQFYFTLTYNFLLIVVLGGMGSVTGTVLASFVITYGLEWLRFFDSPLMIGNIPVPLFRPGLRMVIFSILLMLVVLFFRKGIMGTKEFSWDGIYFWFKDKKYRGLLKRKAGRKAGGSGA